LASLKERVSAAGLVIERATYANTLLFPIAAISRIIRRPSHEPREPSSDVRPASGTAQAIGSLALRLEALELEHNRISDQSIIALVDACQGHVMPRCAYIYLDHNDIGDAGMRALASAIERNTWPLLEKVTVHGNPRASSEAQESVRAALETQAKLARDLEVAADIQRKLVPPAPSLPGFETRVRPGGAFAVTYRTGESSVEQVLAAVRAAGLSVRDVTTEDPSLEDVFVALTYGAADRAG
jgi:hypothetical protein